MPSVIPLSVKQRLYQHYWRKISQYLDKRQSAAEQVTLSQKLIFILPSRYGWWFMLLIGLLYLLGTNYQNNLILLMSYLLLSVFLLSIALCYQNMSGLTLQAPAPAEGFANEPLTQTLQLSKHKPHLMLQLSLHQLSAPLQLTDNPGSVSIRFTAARRGCFALPRIKISSQYPFGLWRAWSYIALKQQYWVYPSPCEQPKPYVGEVAKEQQQVAPSMDTLAPYRSGDSTRFMVWKRLARDPSKPVVRQQPVAPQAEPCWVQVPPATGDALERALRHACAQLLALEQSGSRYGLKLPALTIAQANGAAHLQRCLRELALC